MKSNVLRRALCALAVCGPAAMPALGQTTATAIPEMPVVAGTAPCAAWNTLMLTGYYFGAPMAPTRFELQTGCFDPSAPAIASPEPVSGLILRSDDGYGLRRWISSEADEYFEPVVEMEAFPLEGLLPYIGPMQALIPLIDGGEVAAIAFQKGQGQAARHPGADFAMGFGAAFRTAVHENDLPDGTWFGFWHFDHWMQSYEDPVPNSVYIEDIDTGVIHPVFFEIAGGRVQNSRLAVLERPIHGVRSGRFELAVSQATVTGVLEAELANAAEPGARFDAEWERGSVSVANITGYLVGTPQDPVIVAFGVGTATFGGATGEDTQVVPLHLIAEPLPEGMTEADVLEAIAGGSTAVGLMR